MNDQPGQRDSFAVLSLLCFLLVCTMVLGVLVTGTKLPEGAWTIVGSILTAWAGFVGMVFGFKYGSSQSSKDKDASRDASMSRMQEASVATATALADKVAPPPAAVPAKVEIVNPNPVDVVVVKPER